MTLFTKILSISDEEVEQNRVGRTNSWILKVRKNFVYESFSYYKKKYYVYCSYRLCQWSRVVLYSFAWWHVRGFDLEIRCQFNDDWWLPEKLFVQEEKLIFEEQTEARRFRSGFRWFYQTLLIILSNTLNYGSTLQIELLI